MVVRHDQSASRKEMILRSKLLLEKKIREQLNHQAKYSYLHALSDAERIAFKNNMEIFVRDHLEKFIARCSDILPLLTLDDVATIGSEQPSRIAIEYLSLFSMLEQHGIHNAGYFQRALNFWSGEEAGLHAYHKPNELSDYEIPAAALMHDLGKSILEIQGYYDGFINLFCNAISRVFCTHATGVVNVYLASEKTSKSAGLSTSTNFWEVELPGLMLRYHQGLITDIHINRYDAETQRWLAPVSLFSAASAEIPVRRRNSHVLDGLHQIHLFKKPKMTTAERQQWKESDARPMITFAKMRHIVGLWQQKTKEQKAAKEVVRLLGN